jgi:drug/metabolite transporter (DMT)-like permease
MQAILRKSMIPLLIILLGSIWGSSFILMKRGLHGFPAEQIAAIRLTFAFLALSPFLLKYRKHLHPQSLKFLLVVGLAGNGIPAFLFAYGQTGLPSATVGILNSLTPVFTLLIGAFIFAQGLTYKNIIGVVAGLGGAISLILIRSDGKIALDFTYGGWIIFATLLYAISVNTIRYKLYAIPPFAIACLALTLVGMPAALYLFAGTDFLLRVQTDAGSRAFPYVLTLAIVGTAFSLVLFNKLVQMSGALSASTVTYIIPVVALGWGVLDGESITWVHGIGIAGIAIGISLVNSYKKKISVIPPHDSNTPAT